MFPAKLISEEQIWRKVDCSKKKASSSKKITGSSKKFSPAKTLLVDCSNRKRQFQQNLMMVPAK